MNKSQKERVAKDIEQSLNFILETLFDEREFAKLTKKDHDKFLIGGYDLCMTICHRLIQMRIVPKTFFEAVTHSVARQTKHLFKDQKKMEAALKRTHNRVIMDYEEGPKQ